MDWQQFHASNRQEPAVVDPRRRLRICMAGFAAALLLVFGRTVQLEVTQGEGFRGEALRPVEKETVVPAPRGRILARDRAVLAYDRTIQAVALDYRWLQDPPNERWLRVTVRRRLAKADRRNVQKLAAEKAEVLAERAEVAGRLAKLCGLSPQEWAVRTRRIQARVERIAAAANRRRQSAAAELSDADDSWALRFRRLLSEDPPPPRIIVAEELAHHVVADDVPATVVEEITVHADRYPGAKIVELTRRTYPGGILAAHVLGHLGPADQLPPRREKVHLPNDLVGRTGVERQYEGVLRGRHGLAIDRTDRRGRVLASYRPREPVPGRDVVLTLDATLQHTAEELLHSALERNEKRGRNYLLSENSSDTFSEAGGAIVVMDVRNGAIRAAASAPAFDPNVLVGGKAEELAALLTDPSHPMFDRVSRMAIPPGSTFKVVAAVALLESATIGPHESFVCHGYLHQPDRQRCAIYIRQGVGHGEVALADALAVSCNVYFFHFAGLMGPRPLVDWAERSGFGRPTGIDLPGEAAGAVPSPESVRQLQDRSWRAADTQSLAIGQGSLTATPLQVLRMMAAVANGGKLLTPRMVERGAKGQWPGARGQGSGVRGQDFEDTQHQALHPEPRTLNPISPGTLQAIRDGLCRVVADPKGTAHATVYLESTAIAGKTGTAETGEDRAAHAWFAGYAPADDPKLAFVVVLEHAGDAATAAGPLAKRLVVRMEQLGLL